MNSLANTSSLVGTSSVGCSSSFLFLFRELG
jgi:hypothetical protein